MSDGRTIFGETTMTWADQARLSVRPIVRTMVIFAVLMSAVLISIWAITSSDDDWLLLRHAPVEALVAVARDAWAFLLGGCAFMLAFLIGWYARAFHRFPDPNRRISYEATRDNLTTRDAASFALTVPWSSIVRIRNNDYAMQMWLATGAWRIVFWRAFKAEGRADVLNWARQAGKPPTSPPPATREP